MAIAALSALLPFIGLASAQQAFSPADFQTAMSQAKAAATVSFLTHKPGETYADVGVPLPKPPPPEYAQGRRQLADLEALLAGLRDVQEGCALPCNADADKALYGEKIALIAARLSVAGDELTTAQDNYVPAGVPRKKIKNGPATSAASLLDSQAAAELLKKPALDPSVRQAVQNRTLAIAKTLAQDKPSQQLGAPQGGASAKAQAQTPSAAQPASANAPDIVMTGGEASIDDDRPQAGTAGAPAPPPGSSPLFAAVYSAAQPLNRKHGNVPDALFATASNRIDGDVAVGAGELIPRLTGLIEGARSEIDLQTYVWAVNEPMSQAVFAAFQTLQDRRKKEAPSAPPVHVRLLVDATIPNYAIKLGNVSQNDIGKIARRMSGLDPKYVQWEIASFPHMAQGCLHSKTVIVDGRYALLLTANIQMGLETDQNMFNAGAVLEGPVVAALRAEFEDAWRHGRMWDDKTGALQNLFAGKHPEGLPALAAPGAAGDARMLLLTHQPDGSPLDHSEESPQDQGFLAAINNARGEIHLMTPNLNAPAVKLALVNAIERGAHVDLILSKGFNDMEEGLIGGNNAGSLQGIYNALASAGATGISSRWDARWFSRDGVVAEEGNGPLASHVKFAAFDGQMAILGSANMDTQTFGHSREISVAMDGQATAQKLDAQIFAPAFAKAIPVDFAALGGGGGVAGTIGREGSKRAALDPEGMTKQVDGQLLGKVMNPALPAIAQAALYTALWPAETEMLRKAAAHVDPVTKERIALQSLVDKGDVKPDDLEKLYDGWSGRRAFELSHGLKTGQSGKIEGLEAVKAATGDDGFERYLIGQPQYQRKVIDQTVALEKAGVRWELVALGKESLAHAVPDQASGAKGGEFAPKIYNSGTGAAAAVAGKSLASTALNLVPGVGEVRLADNELHTLRDPTTTKAEKAIATAKNVTGLVAGSIAPFVPAAGIASFAANEALDVTRMLWHRRLQKPQAAAVAART